ncbi:hypothetical protein DICPUDRAFT_92154 [Dictyostelium purpureum]|uniref:Carbohydrate binding domain-containing protein n=1 Tax=Dictyostelium purpureum TaxID=5786 RepID=F0ZMU5_DICPU|nr:uncharacterized protein DICPUDRAFT_92154 [Dictyostelium purpureum]EGC34734.1 hypothetical protein DICPUDRAFT_92154 [Dictyostelium purpureum]|eukprot:XP_003288734.1 hypothetical protein DICPUDRAFT_92154 [Dictyostelium purpureum]
MKFLSSLLSLLVLIIVVTAKVPTHRNDLTASEQVQLDLYPTGSWIDSKYDNQKFTQYEGVIHNNSPFTLTEVNINILNPNGLHLRDDTIWNMNWRNSYPPHNQFYLPPGESIYQNNVYKFTFIVQGNGYPQLELGSVKYS